MNEKLTLKKKKNIFKPLSITETGQKTIGISQSMFESFWNQLAKIDCTSDEKQQCLNRLKEASCWYSRGIAKYHQVQEDEKKMT
jgi:hypothetical protein